MIKSHGIEEKNVFKTKTVRSKPYYNKRQFHKNCLSLGLASGFIEPLEATSMHMTLANLNLFQSLIQNIKKIDRKHLDSFNTKIKKDWDNILKFIVFHYFTKNPINDYWNHYKEIEEKEIFNFHERYIDDDGIKSLFSLKNYNQVSLGMRKRIMCYPLRRNFCKKNNITDFLNFESNFLGSTGSHCEILNNINNN